jgi:hypothetical protein
MDGYGHFEHFRNHVVDAAACCGELCVGRVPELHW